MWKRVLIITLLVVAIIGPATGTYFITKHYTFKSAYANGTAVGYKTGTTAGNKKGYSKGYDDGWARERHILDPSASGGYQSIFSTQTAAPAAAPTVTAPTYCTSTTYGSEDQYTSTDCN